MTGQADLLYLESLDSRLPRGYGGLFHGAYPALVTDNQDPDAQGRVKVSLPWSPDGGGATFEVWARLATTMAGKDRGTWFIPDEGDEVLIVFLGGDPRHPCVLGGLWNGQDAPPQQMDSNNNIKMICSRNGVKITLDDQDGQEKMILETPGGQKVTLKDGPGSIELKDSNGNSIKLETSGITINASAKISLSASKVDLSAGIVNVDSGMSKFSGVVKSDTNLTTSTVSTSYTPGAGNIW